MSWEIRNGINSVLTRTGARNIKVIYSLPITQVWLSAGSSGVKWRHLLIPLEKFRESVGPSCRTDKITFGFLDIPVRVHSASVSGVQLQDEIVNVVYSGVQKPTTLCSPWEVEDRWRGQQLFILSFKSKVHEIFARNPNWNYSRPV
jgi:hypothetical protein